MEAINDLDIMTKSGVKKIIEQDPTFSEFVDGNKAYMSFSICGVHVLIFKEDAGTSYYYKLPWQKGLDYPCVETFMKYAIPVLSELLEERRLNKLIAPNNIRKATLRTI